MARADGEVYRARDTRLGRDVAIKILPPAFVSDPDRRARFEREARVLASLNHPNIAAIYGIEDGPAEAGPHVHALVLELVEGETLAGRIGRSGGPSAFSKATADKKGPPLRVEEALRIARQVADGVPVQITNDRADDVTPDFSPDGSQVAFRSERSGGGIYLVPALGGPARLIVPEGRQPRFSPDGNRIAYWSGQFRGLPSQGPSAVFVASLAGGAATPVVPNFATARYPLWAPDGRSLLILGRRDRSSPLADALDWWWVPLDGGAPVKTGLFALLNFSQVQPAPESWTKSGVVFESRGELWRVPISPRTGRVTGDAVPADRWAGPIDRSHGGRRRRGRVCRNWYSAHFRTGVARQRNATRNTVVRG